LYLEDEVDGEERVENVIRELRGELDEVGRPHDGQRGQEHRRPHAHPGVYREEREPRHGREAAIFFTHTGPD